MRSSSRLDADERDHDLGHDRRCPRLRALHGGLEDGAHLRLVDLRVGDGEAAAAVAEHRVELVQGLVALLDDARRRRSSASATSAISSSAVRQELVQRRIEQADGDRQARPSRGRCPRSPALHRQDLRQRARRRPASSSARIISRTARMRSGLEEHVLGAAEADALGAEVARDGGVERACRRWRAPSGAGTRRPRSSASRSRRRAGRGDIGSGAEHDLAGASRRCVMTSPS